MLVDSVQLDLANLGLGCLDEVTTLNLFANAQARAITAGTGGSLRDITDDAGTPLYPAFFRTRLRIPVHYALSQHRVWDRVSVGMSVRRYGKMMLDSMGMLVAEPALLGASPSEWNTADHPTFEGNALYVVDSTDKHHAVAIPKPASVADLERLDHNPPAAERLRVIRAGGELEHLESASLRAPAPAGFSVTCPRDVARGRAMMFSRFSLFIETAERDLLTRHAWPPLPVDALALVRLHEREVYYLGNATEGGRLLVEAIGKLFAPDSDDAEKARPAVAMARLTFTTRVYLEQTGDLLAVSRSSKGLFVPRNAATGVQDCTRFVRAHS